MLPWIKLGSAPAPDGTELSLWQRGKDLVIRCGDSELMSTRVHGSEELLAERGCEGLGPDASVFIGGLGMAFTLRATLALLARKGRVVVSEIVPAVVDWVRGPIGAGALLDDPRVTVDVRDAYDVLVGSEARFDAILLDVDNGPSALVQPDNRRLYDRAGLAMLARALRPGGRLAVWSAGDDRAFEGKLARAGFSARTERVHARGDAPRGFRHVLFLAVIDPDRGRRSREAPSRPRRDPRSRR